LVGGEKLNTKKNPTERKKATPGPGRKKGTYLPGNGRHRERRGPPLKGKTKKKEFDIYQGKRRRTCNPPPKASYGQPEITKPARVSLPATGRLGEKKATTGGKKNRSVGVQPVYLGVIKKNKKKPRGPGLKHEKKGATC